MKSYEAIWAYKGHRIFFRFDQSSVMVNATHMANAFGKRTTNFLRNESTKEYIKVLLSQEYAEEYGFESIDDIYKVKPKQDTWMCKLLAIKFAYWLSPHFEAWVTKKIEKLVNPNQKKNRELMIEAVSIKKEMNELLDHYQKEERYMRLQSLQSRWRTVKRSLGLSADEEIDLLLYGFS